MSKVDEVRFRKKAEPENTSSFYKEERDCILTGWRTGLFQKTQSGPLKQERKRKIRKGKNTGKIVDSVARYEHSFHLKPSLFSEK